MQMFDLLWVPLIVLIMFMMHPIIGLTMTAIIAIIVGLSIGNQWAVGPDIKRAQSGVRRGD